MKSLTNSPPYCCPLPTPLSPSKLALRRHSQSQKSRSWNSFLSWLTKPACSTSSPPHIAGSALYGREFVAWRGHIWTPCCDWSWFVVVQKEEEEKEESGLHDFGGWCVCGGEWTVGFVVSHREWYRQEHLGSSYAWYSNNSKKLLVNWLHTLSSLWAWVKA